MYRRNCGIKQNKTTEKAQLVVKTARAPSETTSGNIVKKHNYFRIIQKVKANRMFDQTREQTNKIIAYCELAKSAVI